MSGKVAQPVAEAGTSTHTSTIVTAVPVQADLTMNMSAVAVYLGIIVAALAIFGAIAKMLGDRRKDDREWFSGKLDHMGLGLANDIKETKADLKETQNRVHEVEQQRSADREKIILLEKDMDHLKQTTQRIERSQTKMMEDQQAGFKSIVDKMSNLPSGK